MSLDWDKRDYLIAGLLGSFIFILSILVIVLFVLVQKLRNQVNGLIAANHNKSWARQPTLQNHPKGGPGFVNADELSSRGFHEYQGQQQRPQYQTQASQPGPGPMGGRQNNQVYNNNQGGGYNNQGFQGGPPPQQNQKNAGGGGGIFNMKNAKKAGKWGLDNADNIQTGMEYAQDLAEGGDFLGTTADLVMDQATDFQGFGGSKPGGGKFKSFGY